MIPIKNIYYMLAYVFRPLTSTEFKRLDHEQFDNIYDMYASILITGITAQLKKGINHQYLQRQEVTSTPRGRININESIKTLSIALNKVSCIYEDFSVNSYKNRILKTTLRLLVNRDIQRTRRKQILNLLACFRNIDSLDIHNINWHQYYDHNNETYEMLIEICHLVIKGWLQSQQAGNTKLMEFEDDQRQSHLYEKFILAYYRREFSNLHASSPQIPWMIENDDQSGLPVMQSDIILSTADHVLIIDAKYYSKQLQDHFNKKTYRSGNMYQIFTYVKNETALPENNTKQVSGMLLYAKTDENDVQNGAFNMGGNWIYVRTLDLNQDFDDIKKDLNAIPSEIMNVTK